MCFKYNCKIIQTSNYTYCVGKKNISLIPTSLVQYNDFLFPCFDFLKLAFTFELLTDDLSCYHFLTQTIVDSQQS